MDVSQLELREKVESKAYTNSHVKVLSVLEVGYC